MKKFVGLMLAVLFPYIFALGTGGILLLADVFGDIVIPFFTFLVIFALLTVVCVVIISTTVVVAVKKQWDAHELALVNMAIKLVQIPAYVVIFIIGCIYAIGLFHAAIIAVFLFSVADGVSVVLSGSVGAVAAWRGYKENLIDKKTMIILGVCQLIFCVDVISAIMLFMKTRKSKKMLNC